MAGFAIKKAGIVANIDNATVFIFDQYKEKVQGIKVNKSNSLVYSRIFSDIKIAEGAEIAYSPDPEIVDGVYNAKVYAVGEDKSIYIGKVAVRDLSLLKVLARDEYIEILYKGELLYCNVREINKIRGNLRDALLFADRLPAAEEAGSYNTVVLSRDPTYKDREAEIKAVIRQFEGR